ncbi:carbamoyltransferase [Fulvivirga ulvae]|uniref:carbamoyltransferase family protein n=1 Tax=Fulvivirga ulvae TaxID=2904245 RepID=UPI001F2AC7D0|nr:carbamoyltransferase [Fulvivirga ulvae]UII33609.1 carbamoyltransferase [Fulvivirga ulvae]
MNILGISAFYHDSACCLLQDGILINAIQEERLTRIKNDSSLPKKAYRWCLEQAGLSPSDIDCIAYYEDPVKKFARQLWSKNQNIRLDNLADFDPKNVEYSIREQLGYEGKIVFVDHHMSHAASSYFFSGFEDAGILTVDGVGEWATTTYGRAKGKKIDLFEEVHFPNSLGLLYSTITAYLGFEVNEGEYKVMGLAPYGTPHYAPQMRQLITMGDKGQYSLNIEYFDFMKGKRMYSEKLVELIGVPVRERNASLDTCHMDIAKSLQVVLEEILIEKVTYLYNETGSENLCLAGGVALNCVANGKVLKNTPFKNMFVQPASNDSGGALGAACQAHVQITGERPAQSSIHQIYTGPSFSNDQISDILGDFTNEALNYTTDEERLLDEVATRLKDGKVIGWFQGKMEFGPRALGNRSILADPRNPDMRDIINSMVKKREGFRPFAPAVIKEKCAEYFQLDHESPFMLETCQVKSGMDMPAITHVDGSARVQTVSLESNPRFYKLLSKFETYSGVPILLNTSFNVKGEPIVCSVEDALLCFINTEIDCLVLGGYIFDRNEEMVKRIKKILGEKFSTVQPRNVNSDVYTFA